MQLDAVRLIADLTRRRVRRVAIDGCGGSGKSTLARALARAWPDSLVIEMDDFEIYLGALPEGTPDVERLLTQVLEPHAAGRAGRYQRYDWDERRLAEWHDVPAEAPLVIEGVYASCERVRPCLDYAIWVDARYELRLQRGVERDGEAMRATWVEQWMPAEQRYVERERPDERADLVLEGEGSGFRVLRHR